MPLSRFRVWPHALNRRTVELYLFPLLTSVEDVKKTSSFIKSTIQKGVDPGSGPRTEAFVIVLLRNGWFNKDMITEHAVSTAPSAPPAKPHPKRCVICYYFEHTCVHLHAPLASASPVLLVACTGGRPLFSHGPQVVLHL